MKHLRLPFTAALAFGLGSLLVQTVYAQQSWPPSPEQYPADKIPAALKATPVINSHNKALYRTRLQAGSAEGSNFGGHYALLSWGCGEGCTTFFILDELNGHVFDPGFNLIAAKGAPNAGYGLHFQTGSRLLVMEGCHNTATEGCGKYYMLWTGSSFETLMREPQNVTVASLTGQ